MRRGGGGGGLGFVGHKDEWSWSGRIGMDIPLDLRTYASPMGPELLAQQGFTMKAPSATTLKINGPRDACFDWR